MTRPTKRQIEREIEQHKQSKTSATGAVSITPKWREADPDSRPEGIYYDAETRRLVYDLWDAQQACLDTLDSGDYDLVAFRAGYGSGKSILGARWLIAQALTHPGSRFLAMGTNFTKARDATFRVLFEQLPGDRTAVLRSSFNGPEQSPIVADYNRTEHHLTFTNDSVIILGSADDWSRYAGAEFGAIWLDEPSFYRTDLHDLLEMLGSRLRGAAGPKVQCWTLTGNGYNDAWEILEQQQDSTGEPIGLSIKQVRASTLDNPYLDDGTKDRFRRQYEHTEREEQALHGGFAAAQGLVYAQFSRDTHVVPTADATTRVDDSWRVYGYDAGWKSPRVLLEIGKTPYDQLVVCDLFYQTESHVEDVIAWLDANDKPHGTIYCDHDPAHIDRFRRAGYPAERASKSLDDGLAEVRKRLEHDGCLSTSGGSQQGFIHSRTPGRSSRSYPRTSSTEPTESDPDVADGDGQVGLLVADRCKPLIREFYGYTETDVGKSSADDHCLDALRYACMGVAVGR